MADKIYPFKINPTDILIQNEGGGGMLMNEQFISITGNIKPDQQKLLDNQSNVNNVNVQTDVFSSGIFITNVESNSLLIEDLASNNLDSLNGNLTDNNVIIAQQSLNTNAQPSIINPPITPVPSVSPPVPTPTPSVETEEGIFEANFLPATEQEFQLFEEDIDEEIAPEKSITSANETSYVNKVNYNNILVNKTGTTAKDFLPRTLDKIIAPYYNFYEAAKASINTETKNIRETKNGTVGCGAGASIIYLRATGHGFDYINPPIPGKSISLTLGTVSIYNLINKDKKNWKKRSNWTDAQKGDIIITQTKTKSGHVGWVIDTKENDKTSYDIVSNSSKGYTGKGKNASKAGTIQRNYTVKSWSKVARRSGVGETVAFQFIGKFIEPGKTI
jgi:hypothetical protein